MTAWRSYYDLSSNIFFQNQYQYLNMHKVLLIKLYLAQAVLSKS